MSRWLALEEARDLDLWELRKLSGELNELIAERAADEEAHIARMRAQRSDADELPRDTTPAPCAPLDEPFTDEATTES